MASKDRPPMSLRFGQRVKWLRDKRGWTQRELGRRSGLGEARIAKIEAIRTIPREYDDLAAVAAALGVEIAVLTTKSKTPTKDVVNFPH